MYSGTDLPKCCPLLLLQGRPKEGNLKVFRTQERTRLISTQPLYYPFYPPGTYVQLCTRTHTHIFPEPEILLTLQLFSKIQYKATEDPLSVDCADFNLLYEDTMDFFPALIFLEVIISMHAELAVGITAPGGPETTLLTSR